MHRLLAGLCVLSLAAFAGADDKKPAPKATNTAAEFKKLEAEFMKKVSDRNLPAADRKELFNSYAGKFLKLAEDNKDDPAAIDALSFPLRMGAPHDAKAVAALRKDHAKKPLPRLVLNVLASRTDKASQDLLKDIIDNNPDKKTGALAVKSALSGQEQQAKMAAQLRSNEKLREQVEKQRGKEFVKGILDRGDAAGKKVKEYKELLGGKFKGILPDFSVGSKAPEIVSEDVNGKPAKLSDLQGKVVVIDIWATWCGPCVQMIPHSRELVKKLKDKPFVLVSISADAKKQTLLDFMKKNEMPWTHWWNGATGGVIEAWDVQYYPTIYVLDHKGVIRYKDVRGAALDEAVEPLLAEMEKEKQD